MPNFFFSKKALVRLVLGGANICFALIYLFFLLTSFLPYYSLNIKLINQVPVFVMIVNVTVGAVMAYLLLRKKELSPALPVYGVLTVAHVVWFFIYFFSFFYASHPGFSLLILAIAAVFYVFVQKYSQKTAKTLASATFLIGLICVFVHYKESYCQRQVSAVGEMAPPIIATEKDINLVKQNFDGQMLDLTVGDTITARFYTQMTCQKRLEWLP